MSPLETECFLYLLRTIFPYFVLLLQITHHVANLPYRKAISDAPKSICVILSWPLPHLLKLLSTSTLTLSCYKNLMPFILCAQSFPKFLVAIHPITN
jgi:hypothetical protein